jgi:hypothetical protein
LLALLAFLNVGLELCLTALIVLLTALTILITILN